MTEIVFAPLVPRLVSAACNAFFWFVAAGSAGIFLHGWISTVLSIAALLCGAVLTVRAFRIRLAVSEEGLEIRNPIVTRRVSWNSVRAILPGGSILSLASTALGSLSVYRSDQRWGTAIQATATYRFSWPEEEALTKCLLRYQAVHGFAFVTSESFYGLS